MLGYHATSAGIANSDGEFRDKPPYLDWLLADRPGEIKLFYDLDASVGAILALIEVTQREGQRLLTHKKCYLTPYRMTYYPDRFFSVDKGYGEGHPWVSFANAGQYTDVHFTDDNTPEYAIGKAKEALRIGQEVAEAFDRLGLPPTDKLISPISAFKREYLSKLDIPTVSHLPDEVDELATEAIKPPWFEAYTLGAWDNVTHFDLSGAYSSELYKLTDHRLGDWYSDPNPPLEASFGYQSGVIHMEAPFHPILWRNENREAFAPFGTWETVLNLQEIQFLEKYELGKWQPEGDGYWWIPSGEQNEFLKDLISWLWEKRQETEGIDQEIIKRILNSIWGVFLQWTGSDEKPELGEYYNPLLASIVETNIRLRIAETCLDNNIQPLAVMVDGILTDKDLPLELGNNMGQWRIANKGKCIIASSHHIGLEGRGGREEFSITYDWFREAIERDPKAREYPMKQLRQVSLGKALSDGFDKLGQVIEISRVVTIGDDRKRAWAKQPTSGGSLLKNKYQSAPLPYSLVSGSIPELGDLT